MKTTKVLQNFNAGELTPLMDARTDQEKYNSGCRTMENFLPLIYGGAEFRPGTYYVGEAKSSSVKIRLVPFVRSTSIAFILEFGVNYIRFYKDEGRFVGSLLASTDAWADATDYIMGDFVSYGGIIYRCIVSHTSVAAGPPHEEPDTNTTDWIAASLTSDLYPIYELVTPYLEADLYELKFYQSVDVMWITHPDYEPRKLSRLSTTDWSIAEVDYQDGPFLDMNADTTVTITPTATTGAITLTASSALFTTGATAGHSPSGTAATSKSLTGALFKIVHAKDGISVKTNFTSATTSSELTVPEGVKWYFVSGGIWTGTAEVQRSYDGGGVGGTWESVFVCTSASNKNFETSMTETTADAIYRVNVTTYTSGTLNSQIFTTDYNHEGIVEITAVASTTSATATVLKTLGDTQATHRWCEGYWSNKYGFPACVTISPEERLTFAGSTEYPLTLWGSCISNYTSMEAGDEDDDAVIFTLCSDQQNQIQWIITRDVMIVGTDGGEHKISSTNQNEPITPTNIQARPQSYYGSANIQALIVNDALIYIQAGARNVLEMTNVFTVEGDLSYKSDDLTVFSSHITESGITNMAYQRTPYPALLCVRDDGQIAYMVYRKEHDIFSWCRLVTETAAGESDFESVAIIPTTGSEHQIWVSVERVINGATVRYVEFFSARDF